MEQSVIQVERNHPKLDKFAIFDLIGYDYHHPEVERFHRSDARIKVATAPRRGSKSYAASHDVIDTCLLPDTRTWIVGPSYALAEKEFRYIHEALVLNRNKLGLPKPKVCMTNPRSGQLYIRWPWGAVLEGKTADRPESLLGEAVDRIIYSEAAQLPRQIRERYTQPTTITRKGQEIIPTTPDARGVWVRELVEFGENPDYPNIESFQWDITANPTYDREELENARKMYGEDSPVFQEQYLGQWVFYAGRVYPAFQPHVHVIPPFDIPLSWNVVRGIDFGHRDPFVTLWAAVGPNMEIYIYKEYYERKGKNIREHARRILQQSRNRKITLTTADPAGKQQIEDLCYEGVPAMAGNNDRHAGRMRVEEYIRPNSDGVPPFPIQNLPASKAKTKWPRIYVFNTCPELIRELQYYRWKEGKQIEGDVERTEGEDHACDCLRYLLMTRPSPVKIMSKVPRGSFDGAMAQIKKSRMKSAYIGA